MGDQKGSILAEFVIVMPILVFLIFGLVQFSMIWMARLMTHYAAYCAARTAIVYHPDDYINMKNYGPVHRAACIVLAWTGMSSGSSSHYQIHGWGNIPGSSDIENQVSVEVTTEKDLPAVKATVRFLYPLLVPYAGSIIAHFANGGNGKWDQVYFAPDGELKKNSYTGSNSGNYITLTESCVMPCPWGTSSFPLAPASDRSIWGASR